MAEVYACSIEEACAEGGSRFDITRLLGRTCLRLVKQLLCSCLIFRCRVNGGISRIIFCYYAVTLARHVHVYTQLDTKRGHYCERIQALY